MRVHAVTAEQLGVAPLCTEGPLADLRYKFVLIDHEFVYGNVRHHLDLVNWLLRGPLAEKFPTELIRARPIIETEHVLTVFGGLTRRGKIEMIPHVIPPALNSRHVEHLVAQLMITNQSLPEIALTKTGGYR